MRVNSTPHEMSLIWGYGLDFFSVIFWTVNELLEPVSKKKVGHFDFGVWFGLSS